MDAFQLLTAVIVIGVAGALLWGIFGALKDAAKEGYLARMTAVGIGVAALLYSVSTGSWLVGLGAVIAVFIVFKISG